MKISLNHWSKSVAKSHPLGGTGLRPVVLGVAPKTVARREIAVVPAFCRDGLSADESRRDADFDRRDACATQRGVLNRQSAIASHQSLAAFTMMEIAVCLAIIGFALVAIIGVLPYGMHTQRNNQEETIISQDASVLIESIRNGARSKYTADLTNYVYAITNDWTYYDFDNNGPHPKFTGINGYTTADAYQANTVHTPWLALTNDAIIIGLLSTPEFTDGGGGTYPAITWTPGKPIPSVVFGGYSNHITAYVRSISGAAVEKPPQNNSLMVEDTFSYQIICVNAPLSADTNLFYLHRQWASGTTYNSGNEVIYNWTFWRATQTHEATATNAPGQSVYWAKVPNYNLEQLANLRELRLRFRWPQRPNGTVGDGSQNFRVSVGGQLQMYPFYYKGSSYDWLYSYQPQTFTTQP